MRRNTATAVGTGWALALVMLGCGGFGESADTTALAGDTAAVETGDVDPAAQTTVRVADITGNPQRYADQTVTVVADVEEVLSPFAFALDEDSPVAGGIDNDLIVAYPEREPGGDR